MHKIITREGLLLGRSRTSVNSLGEKICFLLLRKILLRRFRNRESRPVRKLKLLVERCWSSGFTGKHINDLKVVEIDTFSYKLDLHIS